MFITSPDMYTRVRGHVTPVSTTSSFSWTQDTGSYGPRYYTDAASIDFIRDIYQSYGEGVWPFKPMQRCHASANRYLRSLSTTRPAGCCYTSPGRWWNGLYAVPLYPFPSALSYNGSSGLLDDDFDHLPDLTDFIGDDMWQRLSGRFENALPSLVGGPDYFVSLVEIMDVLRTFDFLKARKVLDTLSESFLTTSFGLRPLISDLQGLKTLKPAINNIVDLQNGAGKVHTLSVSYREPFEETYTPYYGCPWYCGGGSSPPCGAPVVRALRTRSYAVVKATAKYRYHFPKYMFEFLGDLMPRARALGILPNAESLWDLIPFSFVVDWVVSTEKIFNRWKNFVDPHNVQVEIIDLCVSQYLAYEEQYESTLPAFSPATGVDVTMELKAFERLVGSHALYDRIPWLKLPSFMQLALGAALGWVNMRPI